MRKRLSTTIAAMLLTIAPSMAWADGYFAPFIGANFGGDVGKTLVDSVDDSSRLGSPEATAAGSLRCAMLRAARLPHPRHAVDVSFSDAEH